MTSAQLGQQLTLDFTATTALASKTQEPLGSSTLFGQIPQPGLEASSAPVIRPANPDTSAPESGEPFQPEPPPQTPPASAAEIEPEPPRNHHNYRVTKADRHGSGSLKAKCRDNLAAIELLKRVEADDRRPTPPEKRSLVRYVGW